MQYLGALLISKKKRRRYSPPIRLDQGLSTSPRQINLSPIIYQILYLSARIIYQIKELIWRYEATLLSPIFLRSPFLRSSTPLLLSSSIFLLYLIFVSNNYQRRKTAITDAKKIAATYNLLREKNIDAVDKLNEIIASVKTEMKATHKQIREKPISK